MNYFELFGLEPNFFINEAELSSKLRALLNASHPDRFASSGSQQQMIAMQKTTQLNDAFAVLKHPVRRAQYLLELKTGIDATKEVTVKDPMFLMQQLELREQLETIIEQKNVSDLINFSDNIELMADSQRDELAQEFEQVEWNTQSIQTAIYKLQFLYKTLADIEAAEDKLLD
ncbi:MAG: Fe-S protein assembly co-chaperone HscB [Kangiellaceae bacterium]|nr:Fe-S protein assembly co-chaperone HscB [Kangiellaceae bacterium]